MYEVPEGYQDFSISYMEYFDDDSTGDTYFVFLPPKNRCDRRRQPQQGVDQSAT